MEADDKWKMVEEKQQELRRLTEKAWKDGEWEIAALGERVLDTSEKSKQSAGEMRSNMAALDRELGRALGRKDGRA